MDLLAAARQCEADKIYGATYVWRIFQYMKGIKKNEKWLLVADLMVEAASWLVFLEAFLETWEEGESNKCRWILAKFQEHQKKRKCG